MTGTGATTGTLAVNVGAVNDNPVAVSDVLGVSEDSSSVLIDVLVNDTDADNDTLTVSAPVTDNGGMVTVSDNQINYRPAADFYGTETITYTLTDGNGGTDTGTVTVTVDPVNDAPFMTRNTQLTLDPVLFDAYTATDDVEIRYAFGAPWTVLRTTGFGDRPRTRWRGGTRSRTLGSRHVITRTARGPTFS